jgi:hypothetical protein
MNTSSRLHVSPPLVWAVALLGTSGIAAAAQIQLSCARTPAEAIAGSDSIPSIGPPSRVEMGYRVVAAHWDPLLHQRWATVISCGHPELPAFAVLVSGSREELILPPHPSRRSSATASSPIVHIGDQVHLWSADHNLRIDTSGIAVNSGSAGDTVRVRLPRFGLEAQHIVNGIIRGLREVEIQP